MVKMGILGQILAPGDTKGILKKMNDKVLGIETCKFEFGTIKTTITTYIMAFWTNIRKSPKREVLALKEPSGHTQGVSRSTDKQNYVASN